jgi:hypothetical protein
VVDTNSQLANFAKLKFVFNKNKKETRKLTSVEHFLMAKSGLGIMVSLELSLIKYGGGDSTNDKLIACKHKRSH